MLGKLSGRHALRDRLEQLGYRLDGEELQRAFVRFKGLADRKRDVTDRDLEAIVADERQGAEETFRLEHLQVSCGTNLRPTATVRMLLERRRQPRSRSSTGDGPVDATYRAIDMLVQVKAELEEFAIQAITEGMDAVGEVSVRLRQDGALSAGHGADTDILVAAAKAYVHALNRLTTRLAEGPRITPEQIDRQRRAPVGAASAATMTPRTLFDKIWEAHVVAEEPGEPSLLYVDLHLVHEVTSPQAFESLRLEGRGVRRPSLVVATMDHNVPTDGDGVSGADAMSVAQMDALRTNCDEYGISCFGAGHRWQGIVHVIGPELGLTLPGTTVVCGDSHTATHGAFGAFALGIGTSEVEHVLATQCLRQSRPMTMEVRIEGTLPIGVTAKDAALGVLNAIGTAGAAGHVVEYTGSVVRGFSMEQRMTLCNLTIEGGGRAGMIAPDCDHVRVHQAPPVCARRCNVWDEAVAAWSELRSDDGAALRPRGQHRRGDAGADGDLGDHAGAIGAGHRTGPRPGDSFEDAAEREFGGARPRLHGARAGHARSRTSSWTRSSSARAPTVVSRTCAQPRRCSTAGASTTVSASWWCRDPRR